MAFSVPSYSSSNCSCSPPVSSLETASASLYTTATARSTIQRTRLSLLASRVATMPMQHRESAAAKSVQCAARLQNIARPKKIPTCCFSLLQATCCIQHYMVAQMCIPAQQMVSETCLVTLTSTTRGAQSRALERDKGRKQGSSL